MPLSITKEIQETARKIVLRIPGGIKFTELALKIQEQLQGANLNTIGAQIRQLPSIYPEQIEKPSRGLYKPVKGNDALLNNAKLNGIREKDFYQPFADYLTGELEECSTAVVIGSMRGNGKWGNPDVVGINKPPAHYVIKYEPEVVSAEIKIKNTDTVIAFGQAVAYRLFSHKTYLVIPNTVPESELSKIYTLCDLFGIGLVLFDLNLEKPNFLLKFMQKN